MPGNRNQRARILRHQRHPTHKEMEATEWKQVQMTLRWCDDHSISSYIRFRVFEIQPYLSSHFPAQSS